MRKAQRIFKVCWLSLAFVIVDVDCKLFVIVLIKEKAASTEFFAVNWRPYRIGLILLDVNGLAHWNL